MAQYSLVVNATAHSTINTEDTWIEIFPPAAVSVQLKRIRVSFSHTTVSDVPARIRVTRNSAAGATGASQTPIERRPSGPASVSTCLVKNGTTAFTVGTVVDAPIDVSVNSRGVFEWVARDERDVIESGLNQRLCVCVRVNLASMVLGVEADFEE